VISKDSIRFGSTTINYDITYSKKRKNATLAVYPLSEVEIRVPVNLEKVDIRKLVKRKADWVLKKIIWFNELAQLDGRKEYINGETYLYMGRQYKLKIIRGHNRAVAKILGKQLQVNLPIKISEGDGKRTVKVAIWRWYRQQTEIKVADLIRKYSKKLGIVAPDFFIKNQYKRWGSCTSKNKLIFNFRLSMAPASQIEYVVGHELCHIKQKNHTKGYWKLLFSIMDDYAVRKEALRKDGWQYAL
jgi:predicted metal-dependent hydrolase